MKSQFPLLEGLLPLQRQDMLKDVLAGVTLAALGIPEVMGATSLASYGWTLHARQDGTSERSLIAALDDLRSQSCPSDPRL